MTRKVQYFSTMVTVTGLLALLALAPLRAAEFSADLVQIDEFGDEQTVHTYIKGDLRRDDFHGASLHRRHNVQPGPSGRPLDRDGDPAVIGR